MTEVRGAELSQPITRVADLERDFNEAAAANDSAAPSPAAPEEKPAAPNVRVQVAPNAGVAVTDNGAGEILTTSGGISATVGIGQPGTIGQTDLTGSYVHRTNQGELETPAGAVVEVDNSVQSLSVSSSTLVGRDEDTTVRVNTLAAFDETHNHVTGAETNAVTGRIGVNVTQNAGDVTLSGEASVGVTSAGPANGGPRSDTFRPRVGISASAPVITEGLTARAYAGAELRAPLNNTASAALEADPGSRLLSGVGAELNYAVPDTSLSVGAGVRHTLTGPSTSGDPTASFQGYGAAGSTTLYGNVRITF